MNPSDTPTPTNPSAQADLAQLMGSYLDTTVFAWIGGQTQALTERWASGLPTEGRDPAYVITADDPNGHPGGKPANRRHLRDLLRAVGEMASYADEHRDRPPSRQFRGYEGSSGRQRAVWWPAVGSSFDGSHAEQSVLVAGITRADATDLGRRFHQLAVFELTDELQTVVPCTEGPSAASTSRQRTRPGRCTITYEHLETWWSDHESVAREDGLHLAPRPRCERCGSRRLARISYGLPVRQPPPWVALGGCVVQPGNTHRACTSCGLRS